MSIGIDFGIGIDQNSWYRTGIVSKPKKLVSPIITIYPGRSVTPVRDHIRSCQQHLVNYLNNIARSSKVLLKMPKEFYNFRKWKYFQIHGPSFQYRIYHQRTNMTGLY